MALLKIAKLGNPVLRQIAKPVDLNELRKLRTWPHDVPGEWFKGPF